MKEGNWRFAQWDLTFSSPVLVVSPFLSNGSIPNLNWLSGRDA